MNAQPLHPREQAQWLRLRALRVDRARVVLRDARAQEDACRRQVTARREAIAATRAKLDALAVAVVDQWASEMPRWSEVVDRHRDVLAERLERDVYALTDDERKLERALEVVLRCQAELTRTIHREQAASTVIDGMRRDRARDAERAVELDVEDRRPRIERADDQARVRVEHASPRERHRWQGLRVTARGASR